MAEGGKRRRPARVGGYDADLSIEPLRDDLICAICTGILRDPMMVNPNKCGHTYCRGCIEQQMRWVLISRLWVWVFHASAERPTHIRDVSHDEVSLMFFVSCRPDDVGNECSPELARNTSFWRTTLSLTVRVGVWIHSAIRVGNPSRCASFSFKICWKG